MTEHSGVTFTHAGLLIGGDKPLSKRTISAMITRGDLEAYSQLMGEVERQGMTG